MRADPTPAEFTNEMLVQIRGTFFSPLSDPQMEKRFFQERDFLRQAIAYPARWLKDRGVAATHTLYRRILKTVIDTIKSHGNRKKIERFSVYFLHCVQEHMRHHGDEYYEAAKAARSAADLLPAVLRSAQIVRANVATTALAEAHKILAGRRRIQKGKKSGPELDLFGACKAGAEARK